MEDFGFYFRLGWQHIMSWDALDHLLFITALAALYLLQDWKKVLLLVTAFTIGHSITLAISTLSVLVINPAWVEFLIPCTIIFTAVSNLFQKNFTAKAIRFNYWLALFFGLIHGLGFAQTLRFILAKDQQLGWALLGFNAGLEAGQIIVVLLVLLIAQVFVGILKTNRRGWVLFISVAVFSVAMKLALERWPA